MNYSIRSALSQFIGEDGSGASPSWADGQALFGLFSQLIVHQYGATLKVDAVPHQPQADNKVAL